MLTMTDEQRRELTGWAQSRTLPAGEVFRARLILALAKGHSYRQIVLTLRTTAPTISRWKQRFEQAGMEGLEARHKGSPPRVADAALQARVARQTQRKPTDGSPPLVVPQDGHGTGTEQVDRPAGVDAVALEAAPARALYGIQRSSV